ncbi:MAG TPA: hypothetical protein DIT64_20200 [Verrucomicrobiales bacterium]|nr:hypothetical protein [Verrucomicrobiales bacterium]
MIRAVFQAFILGGMTLLAAAATHLLHPRAPALYLQDSLLREHEITLQQIEERWQNKVLWLDARPDEQYQEDHIPGALQLNEQKFDEHLLALLDTLQTTDMPVIIYCGGEKCEASHRVREKLTPLVPLDTCLILKGGWPAWKAARQ